MTPPRREAVDRRGASGVAAVAAVASSGATVLALCADALRRRELVERAATPARFGGGIVALASGRLADDGTRAAVDTVADRRFGRRPRRLGGAGAQIRRWPPGSTTW